MIASTTLFKNLVPSSLSGPYSTATVKKNNSPDKYRVISSGVSHSKSLLTMSFSFRVAWSKSRRSSWFTELRMDTICLRTLLSCFIPVYKATNLGLSVPSFMLL